MIDPALVADIEVALTALRPFHDFAGTMADHTPPSMVITMGSPMARRQLTMGDVKIARDAYRQLEATIARLTTANDAGLAKAETNVNVVFNTNLPDSPF
ncbi:hypothetical protein [Hyphomicrobium sp.]|uniref:hypothetical protein n=1 Tax=Hyphomicrobium sp. TaxID=82 RepID=UPI001D7FCB75|nr:hypothetical protein [Hyphomicrobium sp.]MBY0561412.1 hypothetical protein [Hyphomicrobium sp.]